MPTYIVADSQIREATNRTARASPCRLTAGYRATAVQILARSISISRNTPRITGVSGRSEIHNRDKSQATQARRQNYGRTRQQYAGSQHEA
jgi:hypothetical protein